MTERVAKWVVDTGWILSFGAVPQGASLLRELFDGSLASSPTVRHELATIASGYGRTLREKDAASKFQGRGAAILLDIGFEHVDVPERDFAQHHLSNKTVPLAGERAASVHGPFPASPPPLTAGEHGGEAEAMAICLRTELPFLMNDPSATPYARARGLNPENAAQSLLRSSRSGPELHQIYLKMEKVTKSGAVVSGPAWFRQPKATADRSYAPGAKPDADAD